MAAQTVSVCKFVGTISLGIATGVSATLSTLALPTLLALPTAAHAHTALSYLSTTSTTLSSYLRHVTTFSLFSAYLLSPPRARHPYLLYTALAAFASGPGVDLAVALKDGRSEERTRIEIEAQRAGEDGEVNGELVRLAVERRQGVEWWRVGVMGLAFAMQVVGLWGDGA